MSADTAVGSAALAAGRQMMAPPPPRSLSMLASWKPLVLEEDEWAQALEAIIERDFFPDIPKMQSKLEWLQALRSRDPDILRQAQQNIAARRAGLRTPIGATPGFFETPGASILRSRFGGGGTHLATPASTPILQRGTVEGLPGENQGHQGTAGQQNGWPAGGEVMSEGGEQIRPAPPMSLDCFLARHTSEDNASFAELLAAMNKRRRITAEFWHPQHVQAPLTLESSLANDHRPTDGFGTSGQAPLRMEAPPHKVKNALYYDSAQQTALTLSDAEVGQRVAGPPKAIMHGNTRFSAPVGASFAGADTPSSMGTPSSDAGEDDRAPSQGPGQGYAVMSTPSFFPGAGGESPFMTWGDIDSTPLRLGDDDMPDIGSGPNSGPQFRMLPNRRKDELGRRMAMHAGSSLKRRAAGLQGTPLARQAAAAASAAAAGLKAPSISERLSSGFMRVSSGGRTLASSRGTPLSAAGQRLVDSIRNSTPLGGAVAADRQLQASYRTPVRRVGGGREGTPGTGGWGTPRVGDDVGELLGKTGLKLQQIRQAALAEKAGKITDNLLEFD